MQALASLTKEHHMISELIGALQTYGARLRSGASVDPADLPRFADVLRELVDYRHHEKEEGILLPLLARNGFAWNLGLLAELRREHGHLGYLLDVLCQASARDSALGDGERRQIAEATTAFVDFKRRHIHKETNELFPAIYARLSPAALEQLALELAQFDEATGRNTRSSRIWQVAEELVQRYSVDSATVDVTHVPWAVVQPKPSEASAVAPHEAAARARREGTTGGLTSFGRPR